MAHSAPSILTPLLTRICLLVVISMCAQIPIMVLCSEYVTFAIFANWSVSLTLFIFSYWLASHGQFQRGRWLLLTGYLSYVTLACLLWAGNLLIQHFLLLGLIGCGCLFKPRESLVQHAWAMAFLLIFIVLSLLKYYGNTWQHHVLLSNNMTFAVAAFMTYFSVVQVSRQYWRHWKNQHQKINHLVHQVFPKWDDGKLSVFSPQPTKHIPACTVLFADMNGYTQLSAHKGDIDTVNTLNFYYQRVDQLAKQFGIEKIKTNGDQYIAVAGLTKHHSRSTTPCPAVSICHFAHQLHRLTEQFNQSHDTVFTLRIGIASGPVVAGVIGRMRPSFDIWGNTVNLAAELEQTCPTRRILVCEQTAKTIPAPFTTRSMPTSLKKHHSAVPYLLNVGEYATS